ncbi:MAG: hypothetical protein KJ587_17655 [Alphaproteobacteria bacterium]|nr:hypothetical protein [Alphaproteobacteria bacterium]
MTKKNGKQPVFDEAFRREAVLGDLEDFVLEGLRPLPSGTLSLAELQEAYLQWCARGPYSAMDAAAFASTFCDLASAIDLPEQGGRFRGIALNSKTSVAA